MPESRCLLRLTVSQIVLKYCHGNPCAEGVMGLKLPVISRITQNTGSICVFFYYLTKLDLNIIYNDQ